MGDRQSRAATTGVELSLILSAVAGVVCIGLAAVAFTLPTTGSVTSAVPYTQNGTLSYAATVAASVLYPSGNATTGDPLFLGSVKRATIQFRYHVSTAVAHAITGTASLAAEVASPTGWKRTLQLQPPTPFSGDSAFLTAPLPLARIEVLVRQVEAMIGGGSFTVTLIPHVSVHGTIAGAALNDRFVPHFAFSLDANQLAPPTVAAAPIQAGSAAPAATNPFVTSTTGSATATHSGARDISLRIVRLTVVDARWLAVAGAGIALCALVASLLVIARGRRCDEAARIESRYGDRLITVTRSDRRSYDEVVELTSITALALVADRYDRMILHEQSDHGHSYRVADEGVLYVYLVGHDRSLLPTLPDPPPMPPPAVAPIAPPPAPAPPLPVTGTPGPVRAATSALEPSRQTLSDRLRQLAREFNSS